ncbi:MAG: DUF3999 family protein [Bacteroidia bacterium]
MSKRLSAVLFSSQLFALTLCSAQMHDYQYKRELKGINSQWHSVQLPDDVFGKVNKAFSDIRIYGITPNHDTVEAPYILNIRQEETKTTTTSPTLLNQVKSGDTYYFTFEIPQGKKLNQLDLDFAQTNFDWRVNLEGSTDGKNWFTVLENYRIDSIENNFTNYKFTSLRFPTIQYPYLRASLISEVKPVLESALIHDNISTPGIYTTHTKWFQQRTKDKKSRKSNLDILLQQPVPVSVIRLYINSNVDFYRPVQISSVTDSTKTPNGWLYHYETLYSGTLSSLEANRFNIGNSIAQKLKIEIANQDNQPLKIDSITILGNVHELIARFDQPIAKYFLVYGNEKATTPQYDIVNFKEKIPADLLLLQVGEEEKITSAKQSKKVSPLIENKLWLWAIMGVIILLLGWFTLKMIRTGESQT